MSELSRRILQRRLELGLSQEELAQRMGYRSKSSITKLEKGVNDIPQSKVEEFAAALETTPAWLMGHLRWRHRLHPLPARGGAGRDRRRADRR